MGIEPATVNIGGEVFNEVGFRDPAGQPVRLLEARTYSPSDRSALEPSRCGAFRGLSMPAADFEPARRFWEDARIRRRASSNRTPIPICPCRGKVSSWHCTGRSSALEPLLVFRDPAMPERIARLRELAVCPLEPPPRGLDARDNALLRAPEGTALLLLQDPAAGLNRRAPPSERTAGDVKLSGMPMRNTAARWGAVSQFLHWLIVALIAIQATLGLTGRLLPLGVDEAGAAGAPQVASASPSSALAAAAPALALAQPHAAAAVQPDSS